jgi:DNA topoisomerase-3
MGPLEAKLKDLVAQSLSVVPQGLSGLGKKVLAKAERVGQNVSLLLKSRLAK